MTHTATGTGFTVPAAQLTRGWTEEEWATATAGLADRGLMSDDGTLTDDGIALRTAVEAATDEMASAPWDVLGEAGTARLKEIGKPLVRAAVGAGAFPAGVFA